jgi:transcriptional regulator GlxA family with amidase domain
MAARLAHPITVADIAAACGLGPRRLHALFREQAGETPHMALTRLRLDQARGLLAHTDLPIAEIALRSGHADQSALTRRLRAVDRLTPAAFRRRARARADSA